MEVLLKIIFSLLLYTQGPNEGEKGGTIPRALNHYGTRRMTAVGAENPNNITSTFFNTVHLLPNDLKFEHGGAKLTCCPGRHQTSLRPYVHQILPVISMSKVQRLLHFQLPCNQWWCLVRVSRAVLWVAVSVLKVSNPVLFWNGQVSVAIPCLEHLCPTYGPIEVLCDPA